MGIMVSEVYEALVAAGAPEDKAKAAAGWFPQAATPHDCVFARSYSPTSTSAGSFHSIDKARIIGSVRAR